MEIFVLLWFLFSIGVGFLAAQRGRSGVGWTLLSIVTSPLLAVIILLLTRDLVEEAAVREQETRRHDEKLAALASTVRTPAPKVPSNASPVTAASPLLVADELEKLSGLKARGLITDDEFQQQKRRLLGGAVASQVKAQPLPDSSAVRKTPVEKLRSAGSARAALVALGCTVSGASEGPWAVNAPSGSSVLATSHADLVDFYSKL